MSGLRLSALKVIIDGPQGPLAAVEGVSLEVARGECLTLLGESGCGKTLTALALMRLLPEGLRIAAGEAWLGDTNLFALPEKAMRAVRGGRLAMIFQEPMLSLNPVMSVGAQIGEALRAHGKLRGGELKARVGRLLADVGLQPALAASYPFQLSGGQRQRALIAMMLAGEPELLIADEPTTALDVTVQAQILRLLKRLQKERGMGLLLISHDLDVARDMADRVAVMYAGQIVEWADCKRLFEDARHPYTRTLMRLQPALNRRGEALTHLAGNVPPLAARSLGCRFAERCPTATDRCRAERPAVLSVAPGHWVRCHLAEQTTTPYTVGRTAGGAGESASGRGATLLEVQDLAVHFPIRRGLFKRTVGWVRAVDSVSLRLARGETLALVGESGCGKTTLARALLRLVKPTRGTVRLKGQEITGLAAAALRQARAKMQIVFQDPYASLNPRMRVGEILEEGLLALRPELSQNERQAKIAALLERVGLEATAAARYPHTFSGGQRQRIAIARALAVDPEILICDEPTSALDVSVQAQIINLLKALQREEGLAYLFITHNLSLVGYLADRVMVMYLGRIVEEGPATAVFAEPLHPYTQLLLSSAPGRGLQAEAAASGCLQADGRGCRYLPRCPMAQAHCHAAQPPLHSVGSDRQVACHLWSAG